MIGCVILSVLAATLPGPAGAAFSAATGLRYRPAGPADVPAIASLLTQTFEDVPPWNIVRRKLSDDRYAAMLHRRFAQLVDAGAKHCLVVSVDPAGTDDGTVVAFMELGTLPAPVAIDDDGSRPDMPYLANVAVSDAYRRNGIGTTLVRLAVKIGRKWCSETTALNNNNNNKDNDNDDVSRPAFLFLAVDKDNDAAVAMYERLRFVPVVDETEKLSAKELQKLKRKPRLYFQKDLNRQSHPPQQQ